jgi:dipeptidyl aminopeptidase/acylaminoacyl peptidase
LDRSLTAGVAVTLLAGVLVVVVRGSSCPAFAETTVNRAGPDGGEDVPRVNIALTDAHLRLLRRVTHDNTSNEAAFSPDGRQVAYASGRGFPNETEVGRRGARIRVMDVDGGHDHVVSDGYDVDPVWSPDGSQLAFIRASSPAGLWRVDVDTGRQTEIAGTAGASPNVRPQWLTTGRIIFTTDAGVESIPSTGGSASLVVPITDRNVTFSADGSRYALSPGAPDGPIQVVETSTKETTDVPRSATEVAVPLLWTGDNRLVFTRNVAGADLDVVSWRPGDDRPTLVGRVRGFPLDLADNPVCAP